MALGLLWKPKGLGSQEALGHLKKELGLGGRGRMGLGHTGILDPFAEGYLLCGVGEGTKLLAPLMGLDKVYEATLCFGVTSDTLDDTGTLQYPSSNESKESVQAWLAQSDSEINSQLKEFLKSQSGTNFDQVPPHFSAVHVDGKRSYEWARMGVAKELKARRVTVKETVHHDISRDEEGRVLWRFSLRVSAGTYIRALARDWALDLCGFEGHLQRLVRHAVGPFGKSPEKVLEGSQGQAEASFWEPLGVEDFEGFFDFRWLSEAEAHKVRQNGIWTAEEHERPQMLIGPAPYGPVAWTEALTGKLGRVFLENPFEKAQ